jgi:hypothetical protein
MYSKLVFLAFPLMRELLHRIQMPRLSLKLGVGNGYCSDGKVFFLGNRGRMTWI